MPEIVSRKLRVVVEFETLSAESAGTLLDCACGLLLSSVAGIVGDPRSGFQNVKITDAESHRKW